LWNKAQLDEGRQLLQREIIRGAAGPYAIQAAIADLHLRQPRDWAEIAALYEALARLTGSPVVEMNRAIAVAEIDGPEAGLAILARLDLDHYRYFHSTRAELLRRAGRDTDALGGFRRARDLARRILEGRIAGLTKPPE
jgi:RNA polymerase sigma-70 factor, ECF subfamily